MKRLLYFITGVTLINLSYLLCIKLMGMIFWSNSSDAFTGLDIVGIVVFWIVIILPGSVFISKYYLDETSN